MTAKSHIMYVDDEADIRAIVEYALEDEADIRLELCTSGKEAIEKAVLFKPDIILLDVMMPGMDGPTTLKQLRELDQTRTTPVIFVTAKAQPNEIAQFKALGAVDVIAKPFEPMALAPVIRRHLSMTQQPAQSKKSQRIEALREIFRNELPNRLAAIQTQWKQLLENDHPQQAGKELHLLLHSLGGSGQSFGYKALGLLARDIEKTIADLIKTEQTIADELRARISGQIAQLNKLAESGPDIDKQLADNVQTQPDPNPERLVYIVEDDTVMLDHISSQLQLLGWQVSGFTTASAASEAMQQTPPSAVIVDLALQEGKLAGIDLLNQFQAPEHQQMAKIVISAYWTWETRLASVRAGVDTFLPKPLDMTYLVERLEELTIKINKDPYKVLIVEDTVELAHYYADILEQAGMQTTVVSDPIHVLDALSTFHPELILMDLYMPECSGIEVARVIRQDRKFLSVPIVFLSTESERERQLGALQTGADDFLVKPIADAELIAAVSIRAERFRNLSAMIRQDSLTGLLNHISLKLQMDSEYARAKRGGSVLTFALLDIDHFKQVNDSYGHPVGDQVLKAIAQLLKTRLRKSDVIGRYGGEEFGVLMPDTTLDHAYTVIDELRKQFSLIPFVCEGVEFTCTLSTGLSTAPPYLGIDELILQADNAMYEAKKQGRNRICIAPETSPPHLQSNPRNPS